MCSVLILAMSLKIERFSNVALLFKLDLRPKTFATSTKLAFLTIFVAETTKTVSPRLSQKYS